MHYDIFMFQLQADLPNNAINGVRIRIKLQNTIHVVFFFFWITLVGIIPVFIRPETFAVLLLYGVVMFRL